MTSIGLKERSNCGPSGEKSAHIIYVESFIQTNINSESENPPITTT